MTLTSLTPTPTTSDERDLSSDELVARAAALVPFISEHASKGEEQRCVVPEVVDAIAAAGLYRLSVPQRFGGLQTDVSTSLRVSAELARGDGSTAWVSTLMNVCNWVVGLFPEQAQQDVWGGGATARTCGVVAPTGTANPVDGGYVVSGSWGFASGSAYSQWAVLGVAMMGPDGEPVDQGMALMPVGELSIKDTWFVAGMRGTSSNTLIAEEVFVPTHRVMSVSRAIGGDYPTERTEEALYRSALVPVLAIVLAAPQVGMAKHALELVQASLAKGRGISYTFYDKSVLAPTTQLQVAEAAQLIDQVELLLMRAGSDVDTAAASGEYMDFLNRARVRADTGSVVKRCREAIDLLLNVHGAGSFAEANPMQRVWRDSETGSRHAVVNPEIALELYARALLGVEEQITALI